jgi:hypothetical protein
LTKKMCLKKKGLHMSMILKMKTFSMKMNNLPQFLSLIDILRNSLKTLTLNQDQYRMNICLRNAQTSF